MTTTGEQIVYRGRQEVWSSTRCIAVKHYDREGKVQQVAITINPHMGQTFRSYAGDSAGNRGYLEKHLDEMERGIKEARQWLREHS